MKTSLNFRCDLVAGLAMIFLLTAGAQQFKRAYDLVPAPGATPFTVDAQILGRTVQIPGEAPTAALTSKRCQARCKQKMPAKDATQKMPGTL